MLSFDNDCDRLIFNEYKLRFRILYFFIRIKANILVDPEYLPILKEEFLFLMLKKIPFKNYAEIERIQRELVKIIAKDPKTDIIVATRTLLWNYLNPEQRKAKAKAEEKLRRAAEKDPKKLAAKAQFALEFEAVRLSANAQALEAVEALAKVSAGEKPAAQLRAITAVASAEAADDFIMMFLKANKEAEDKLVFGVEFDAIKLKFSDKFNEIKAKQKALFVSKFKQVEAEFFEPPQPAVNMHVDVNESAEDMIGSSVVSQVRLRCKP